MADIALGVIGRNEAREESGFDVVGGQPLHVEGVVDVGVPGV